LALNVFLVNLLLGSTSAAGLRVANPAIHIPSNPPPTMFQVVPAFTGIMLTKPTCLASPPGDTRRLFVGEKESGKIKVIPDVTVASPVSHDFLSLSNIAAFDDQGILGLAFHPNYGTNALTQNAYCYVFYSWKNGNDSYSRLSRLTVTNPAAAAPSADPQSEFVLLEQLDRAGFHPGGDLHFGPDGYLYISLGDEGFYNDSFNNAQHIDGNFYSAIARIDVDKRPGSLEPNVHPAVLRDGGLARYSIPPDNPFIGATNFNGFSVQPSEAWTEFWAVGFVIRGVSRSIR
jgi:glucose/arabinose dehydrogenase